MISKDIIKDRIMIESKIFHANDDYNAQLKGYSNLFLTICNNATELKYEIERMKKTIDQTFAFLSKEIRGSSKIKLTETMTKNEVYLNESYIELNKELLELGQEHSKWLNLKQVFENDLQILLCLSSLNSNKNKFKKF